MGIVLSEAELQMSDHIRLTANKVSLLSQDYWSWEKEYLDWKHNGTRVLNVVEFLSKTDGITFGAAKEKVKAKIIEAQEEFYEQIGRFFTVNPSVSDALRSDIESMGLTLGGFNYWAMFSPRYQDWKKNPLLAADIAASMTETAQVHTSLQGSQIDSSQEQSQPCGDNIEVSKAIKPRGEGENDCSKRMCRSCDTEEEVDMWRKPSEAAIRAPSNFIFSSPSKGTRSGLIGAFNTWIGASTDSTTTLTDIIRILHDASLLIDDVQDDSKMRRGNPAAHTIFGMPQTVNSGLFMFTEAVEEARRFKNELSMDILLDTLQRLYLGQSWDLYWKHNLRCPSKEEYLHMVDNKTGSMFRMIARLLQAESEAGSDFESSSEVNFDKLTLLFGRFFQIRDDYMNLKSAKYSDQKGFCEDFDEGKYSFPIVHLLCHHPQYRDYVTGIFRQLPVGISQGPRLSYEMKVKLRDIFHDTGTLRDTFALVQKLAKDLQEEISKLEDITGKRNATLRLLVIDLSVKRTDD
ncbi:geranylgeranyl pyrophosphate synthase [Penicillium diatomitis]|uniref:Geranylgeranyl pyrophosphate synthase n=1 Tax=Penicillium diatomitis TaxID=2819901 RepID=A0A9W9XGK2_9EURO|nr:geranylgeranyl pyrophosphate synthase [Penicillium diatomitis]KAJ5491746.1 geranylgeranyl pyrophosphate synthase [Penicillium diatomitis]